ncbi:hypothetical protein [Ferrovibrio terrae]|uniref:hypothetical protein n=1 Tax=Ferrovibrio terrae TaxID=2594003 RepID=UPI0031378A2F
MNGMLFAVAGRRDVEKLFPDFRKIFRLFSVFAVLALTVACAQVPKQAFNKEAHTEVKRIALFEPAKPEEYVVYIANHPGGSFGLIGALVAAADTKSKTDGFTSKMKELQVDFAASLTAALEQELVTAKYDVVRFTPTRAKPELLDSYAGVDVEADAYLDWVINWNGFIAPTATSDYLPSARVYVRLVDARTKAVLYAELIGYGYQHGPGQPIELASDAKYRFGNYSTLIEGAQNAAEALNAATPLIVRKISTDIGR